MIKNSVCALAYFALLATALCGHAFASAPQDYFTVSCSMHIHSIFSGKSYTLDKIAGDARAAKIDSIILTDHDIMRWEYGIYPLRNILKRVVERPSVLAVGPSYYLKIVKQLQENNPDIIIIPGVESTAFYYWTGSPFRNNLVLNNWHKHILVLGMAGPDAYKNLPVVSNVYGGAFRPWQLIWPLTLIVLGLLLFKRSITLAFFVALGGATAMVSNYPFYYHQFDQYHGDQGDRPYQALIDYANNNGALTYWAHPDAPNWESPRQIGPVKIETPPYASSLLHTKGYTGFAIFAEGMHSAGLPGHEWDQTLLEYCNGERTQPVWSIGELDYGGKKSFLLNEITNFVYVKNKSAQDILSSLKAGKNYVRWTPNKAAWKLDMPSFYVQSGNNSALCGETIPALAPPKIYIKLTTSDNKQHPVSVRIIRNGKLHTTIEAFTPGPIIYEDAAPLGQKHNYYRVFIDDRADNHLATNPVFLTMQ